MVQNKIPHNTLYMKSVRAYFRRIRRYTKTNFCKKNIAYVGKVSGVWLGDC